MKLLFAGIVIVIGTVYCGDKCATMSCVSDLAKETAPGITPKDDYRAGQKLAVVLGDSIMEGAPLLGNSWKQEEHKPGQVSYYLQELGYEVINAAIGGFRCHEVLGRMDEYLNYAVNTTRKPVEFIIINCGINDISTDGVNPIPALKEIFIKLDEMDIDYSFVNLGYPTTGPGFDAKIKEVNDWLDEQDIDVIDYGSFTKDHPEAFLDDGYHPTIEGHDMFWTEVFGL